MVDLPFHITHLNCVDNKVVLKLITQIVPYEGLVVFQNMVWKCTARTVMTVPVLKMARTVDGNITKAILITVSAAPKAEFWLH